MYRMMELQYLLNSLEPYISANTLKYHYEILYKGYVDNFNKVLLELMEARRTGNYANIKCLEKNLSFNGAGATLHTLYFENLAPQTKTTSISHDLLRKINEDFGSFDAFYNQFLSSTSNIEGSGWGIVGYNKSLNKLLILQCEKHQDLTIWDFVPLLVIDIWEHAYYLDYQADKRKYLVNVFNIINWDVVNRRFEFLPTSNNH